MSAIRMILSGCSGFMGHVITELAAADPDIEIAAGIDPAGSAGLAYPVFADAADCDVPADVLVDFSSPKALDSLIDCAKKQNIPVVFCTTGYTQEQLEQINSLSGELAVMKSANMSLGVNLLMKLVEEGAKVLFPAGFDMEVVEKHHNRKLDAPSGTALALADSLKKGLESPEQSFNYVYDRSQVRQKRQRTDIGISSVRGGTIVGEHEVIFAGLDEVVELKHTAFSRSIFAKGAVEAAKWIAGKPAGFYDMGDVLFSDAGK